MDDLREAPRPPRRGRSLRLRTLGKTPDWKHGGGTIHSPWSGVDSSSLSRSQKIRRDLSHSDGSSGMAMLRDTLGWFSGGSMGVFLGIVFWDSPVAILTLLIPPRNSPRTLENSCHQEFQYRVHRRNNDIDIEVEGFAIIAYS